MMTLVSRRTLPAIRLDFFATFLDGMRHGIKIRRIDTTYEAHEVAARRSGRHGKAAGEIQDLPLLRSIQAFNLVDNLVFNSLCHSEANLGKGLPNVKARRNHLSQFRLVCAAEQDDACFAFRGPGT